MVDRRTLGIALAFLSLTGGVSVSASPIIPTEGASKPSSPLEMRRGGRGRRRGWGHGRRRGWHRGRGWAWGRRRRHGW